MISVRHNGAGIEFWHAARILVVFQRLHARRCAIITGAI
jgi:light-regulated signal transduction histidine kinase (bacteriophytochrome)